ncbi:hypothetical protein MBLNU230_g4696t1 [Neophaeotheca triangularis]
MLPFQLDSGDSRQNRLVIAVLVVASFLDILIHLRSYHVKRPLRPLDEPFAKDCKVLDQKNTISDPSQAPLDVSEPRENATILVLARNSELDATVSAIRSIEKQWNQWYHYPIIFLNDKPWDPAFKDAMRRASQSELTFDQIPTEMWSWPSSDDTFVDRQKAETAWEQMSQHGIPHVNKEGYHHMCRFYSGFFYDYPALLPYKYYWRVEPEIQFTCRIPYDPFRLMRLRNKVYGYTLALWEIGSTCPTLFRTTANFKESHNIPTTSLWTSMIDASWAPTPIRQLFMSIESLFHSRTRHGDAWNFCHFWSNFEIADLDFYRSEQYRAYFADLDRAGGFYTERWGDAAVHSLALGMFTDPAQVHFFEDIGYVHPPFQNCPGEGVGCDCECTSEHGVVPADDCLRALRAGVGG